MKARLSEDSILSRFVIPILSAFSLLFVLSPTLLSQEMVQEGGCYNSRGQEVPCPRTSSPPRSNAQTPRRSVPRTANSLPWWKQDRSVGFRGDGLGWVQVVSKSDPWVKWYSRGKLVSKKNPLLLVDRIVTGRHPLTLALSGGHNLTIGPNTNVKLDQVLLTGPSPLHKVFLSPESGWVRFWNAVVGSRRGRFTVTTPRAVSYIRGTDFTIGVNSNGDDFVRLADGAIDLVRLSDLQVLPISRGQTVTFPGPRNATMTGLAASMSRLYPSSRFPSTARFSKASTRRVYVNVRLKNGLFQERNQTFVLNCAIHHRGGLFYNGTLERRLEWSIDQTVWSLPIVRRDGGQFSSGEYKISCGLNGQKRYGASFFVSK